MFKQLWSKLKLKVPLKATIFILLSLLAFFAFSIYLSLNNLHNWDLFIAQKIQNLIPKNLDTFLSVFSLIGSFEVLTLILGIILIKKNFLKSLLVASIYFIGLAIEYFMKVIIYHPGPPARFFRYNLKFFFSSTHIQTGHSYPSGHSYRTIFIAVLLAFLIWYSRKLKINQKIISCLLLISFCLIMLVSRVSLGEHWPTDVLAGGLFGLSLGYLSSLILIF